MTCAVPLENGAVRVDRHAPIDGGRPGVEIDTRRGKQEAARAANSVSPTANVPQGAARVQPEVAVPSGAMYTMSAESTQSPSLQTPLLHSECCSQARQVCELPSQT